MKLTHVRPFIFVLLALSIVISVVLVACGSAPAPEPVEAEAPATEIAPTETPPTELPQSEFVFEEGFADNSNSWNLVTEKTEYGYSDQIQDGQLVMSFEQEGWNGKSLPIQLSNVDMSFTPSNASFGALCRAIDNDNYYILRLDGDGYYMMGKMVGGEWEELIEWTQSAAVKLGIGETNRIRVVCSDSDFELYANDQLLIKTQDTSLTTGEAALMASHFDVDDGPILVAFDNLEVK